MKQYKIVSGHTTQVYRTDGVEHAAEDVLAVGTLVATKSAGVWFLYGVSRLDPVVDAHTIATLEAAEELRVVPDDRVVEQMPNGVRILSRGGTAGQLIVQQDINGAWVDACSFDLMSDDFAMTNARNHARTMSVSRADKKGGAA